MCGCFTKRRYGLSHFTSIRIGRIDTSRTDKTNYEVLQRKAHVGLAALEQVAKMLPIGLIQLPASSLLRVTAFTNPADPWTNPESFALSRTLLLPLQGEKQREKRTKLIVDEILTNFLRPLFSKSRPAAVTASGRKAEYVEPSRYDNVDQESSETKPWKYVHRYAITVFAWAVRQADVSAIYPSMCSSPPRWQWGNSISYANSKHRKFSCNNTGPSTPPYF